MKHRFLPVAAALFLGVAPVAEAADQARDDAQCGALAVQQTGFDPARPPPVAVANQQVTGSGARVKGAAAGAVIGGVSGGNAGEAAVAGAVVGGVAHRSRARRAARAQNEAVAQQQQGGMAAYNHAKANCMAQRGYKAQ